MEGDAVRMVTAAEHERGGCCITMTLRDYGRLAQFVLDGGKAGDRQILPPRLPPGGYCVQSTTTGQLGGAGYGSYWWVPGPDAYEAISIFGQSIAVVPQERLIVVINSAWPKATGSELSAMRGAFVDAVRAAESLP